MTRGLVVVLGKCGRNFAAGMSGGLAFVLDVKGDFAEKRCNTASVDLEPIQPGEEDETLIRTLIERHVAATESPLGKRILENWEQMLPKFLRIFPHEYRRALAAGEKVGHAVSFPAPVIHAADAPAALRASGD
jgi:glutamate synthase domain-containing protein 3